MLRILKSFHKKMFDANTEKSTQCHICVECSVILLLFLTSRRLMTSSAARRGWVRDIFYLKTN